MTVLKFKILPILAVLLILAAATTAQEERRWSANVGGGFTPLLGDINTKLDNGWHISFGAGAKVASRLTLGGEVMYNGLGVSRGVIAEAAVPNANAHLWAFTAEPKLDLREKWWRGAHPYLIGGVGYYRRVVEFTAPTTAAVTIFDPFFGFVPIVVPANQVLGRNVRDGIGGNLGLGFDMAVSHDSRTKIFAEARFHYFDGGGTPTRMLPFTIGVRF
jgi:hypothetical protein